MITVEYRLPLPLSLSEYNRALRYVVARVAESTSGEHPGEGVEIQLSEPFACGTVAGMASGGMHTVKSLKFRSRLPALLRRVVPNTVTEIVEESWFSDGEASRCKTVYRNPFLGDRFKLCIESNHVEGVCTEENAVGLEGEDLERREVILLDIAGNVPRKIACEDPSEFLSEKTGRGRLVEGWFRDLMGLKGEKGVIGGEDRGEDGDCASAESNFAECETEETASTESGSEGYASAEEVAGEGEGEAESQVDGKEDVAQLELKEVELKNVPDSLSSASSCCSVEGACCDSLREAAPSLREVDGADADGGAIALPDASVVTSAPGSARASSSSSASTSVSADPPPPTTYMTCYKVVKMEFTGFGLRRFVQRWTTRAVVPNSLIDIHRKIFCWMDEWCDLTRKEIEELEEQTAEVTRAKMKTDYDGEACGTGNVENKEEEEAEDAIVDETASVKKEIRGLSAFDYEYVDG